jgi:hypothetical protein
LRRAHRVENRQELEVEWWARLRFAHPTILSQIP